MRKVFLFIVATMLTVFGAYAETFTKVTDAWTLKDGDKVILVNETSSKASSAISGKYITAEDVTIDNAKISITEPTTITLNKQNNGFWQLAVGNSTVGHTSSKTDITANKNIADFEIDFDIDGNVLITSQTKVSNKNAVFLYNAQSPRFALYTSSTMQKIQLYVLDETTVVDKVPTSVTISAKTVEMRVGDAPKALTATVLPADAADKSVTWGSTNTEIVTVSEGTLTAVAAGQAKVWVKTNKGENVSDTCVVTILPALDNSEATYKAVQKADYLPAGAKVFFGTIKDGENYVMGLYTSGNNIKGVAATYGEGRHSVTASKAYAYTVEKDGDNYLFKDQDGKYLRTISSTKLGSGDNDDYAKWILGSFDEDDATVLLTNAKSTSSTIYNNFQGTNDMFNVYNSPSSDYCAKIVLYSDQAQEWVERTKNPVMSISGEDVADVNGTWVMDYGKVEKDEYVSAGENPYYDGKKFTITYGDLTDDISVTITGANASMFNLPMSGDVIAASGKKTGSATMTVYWEAATAGVYTATLTFHTATEGVEDIVVTLKAEAIDKAEDPQYQPSLTISKKSLYLNPNYTGDGTPCSDMDGFTFSATNLAKALYVKWEHTSSVLFQYAYENSCMSMLVGEDYVGLNQSLSFAAGQDYKDIEVYASVDNLTSTGKYTTKLHFYSYKAGSKTDLAIDEYVDITINMTTDPTPNPATALEQTTESGSVQKVLHNGSMFILREGKTYDLQGKVVE